MSSNVILLGYSTTAGCALLAFGCSHAQAPSFPPLAVAPFDADQAGALQQAWASHLSSKVRVENSIGMPLVLIPPGEFVMGSAECEEGYWQGEGPPHLVRITRPFYLGARQVTVSEFARFVAETGYLTGTERSADPTQGSPNYSWRATGYPQTGDHPVVHVTWQDAREFCRWLSKHEGQLYRLPTEAEWEYACRAGSTTRFHFGNDPEGLACVANTADATAKEVFPHWGTIRARDGFVFTAPVASFTPNAFGLYDMHGNVWEWCADWYDPEYYSVSPLKDPAGPVSGSQRVARGGSWSDIARLCRSASRGWAAPDLHNHDLGFRVVQPR